MTDEIKIALPDDIIREHIKVAVAQAITCGDPEKLVQEFVKQALTEHDRYSRDTSWSKTVKSLIEEMAKKVLAEWVEQN